MKPSARLTIGTRGSPLALAQAELVRRALAAACPELAAPEAVAVRVIRTSGDRFVDRPLTDIGGKGLFTKEIEEALLDGGIDIAVHSMKDVPTELPEGLVIAACLPRADPRDAMIGPAGVGLSELPPGAVIGTASLRRAAQVRALRPDLGIVNLRGNVQTRLDKVRRGEVAATFLAAAGLERLGLLDEADRLLDPEEMLPAVAQGAIGVEARRGDEATLDFLERIDHLDTRRCVEAERVFLAALDGSCRTPIAALCEFAAGRVCFRGLLAAPDGSRVQRVQLRGDAGAAAELAAEAARMVRTGMDGDGDSGRRH